MLSDRSPFSTNESFKRVALPKPDVESSCSMCRVNEICRHEEEAVLLVERRLVEVDVVLRRVAVPKPASDSRSVKTCFGDGTAEGFANELIEEDASPSSVASGEPKPPSSKTFPVFFGSSNRDVGTKGSESASINEPWGLTREVADAQRSILGSPNDSI